MKKGKKLLALVAILSAFIFSSLAYADDVEELAKKLIELRGSVEQLNAELEQNKAITASRMESLAIRKNDLDLQIQKEQFRLKQIEQSIQKKKDFLGKHSASAQTLVPLAQNIIEELTKYIKVSLPFRKEERLAELNKLANAVNDNTLTAQKALTRLWSFVEDEFRLTKESGLYQHTITLGDKEVLAEVARIGMVMMFFRTDSGITGWIEKRDKQWIYVTATNSDQVEAIIYLFESFKKQIRQGYFTVPNALVSREVK